MHYLEKGDVTDAKRVPADYGRGADGYGRRIATDYMVRVACDRRWRRVFVCCISNAGTTYVEIAGTWHVIRDYSDVAEMLQALPRL